jgi:hypothetical protein
MRRWYLLTYRFAVAERFGVGGTAWAMPHEDCSVQDRAGALPKFTAVSIAHRGSRQRSANT